jgi:P27 family predicted phage terminase small subunit
MAGPPPKPTAQLRLTGTWRGKKRQGEPKVDIAVPDAPDWLSDEAKAAWDELATVLAPMMVVSPSDAISLAQLAEYLAQWKKATAALKRYGEVMPTRDESGKIVGFRRSPWVAMQMEYGLMLRRLMAEFGMTPSARARLGNNAEDPKEALFSRKPKAG